MQKSVDAQLDKEKMIRGQSSFLPEAGKRPIEQTRAQGRDLGQLSRRPRHSTL